MKKTLILCKFLSAIFLLLNTIFLLNSCSTNKIYLETADYVNPFIGTDGHGHTFPGATVPFGMVQLNPNTRLYGWDGCSGYHYSDSVIFGFAHTALSGTGSSDYGDILIMPVVGKPVFDKNEYSSPFKKKNEQAEAGYYKVFLDKPTVWAELTAAARTGFHRYTFPETNEANLIIDLQHRDKVINSYIEFVSDTEIQGMRRSTNFAKDKTWFFYAKFSKPYKNWASANNEIPFSHINEHLILPVPVFNYETKPITEKITVTIESATQNVEIFYTVDGSVPTTKSKKYFEPITVDKSLTVKAIAYSKEFGSSSVAEAKFVIIKQQ